MITITCLNVRLPIREMQTILLLLSTNRITTCAHINTENSIFNPRDYCLNVVRTLSNRYAFLRSLNEILSPKFKMLLRLRVHTKHVLNPAFKSFSGSVVLENIFRHPSLGGGEGIIVLPYFFF